MYKNIQRIEQFYIVQTVLLHKYLIQLRTNKIFLYSFTYSHFFLLTFLGLSNEKNSVKSFVYLRTEMTWLTLGSRDSRLRGENNMFI